MNAEKVLGHQGDSPNERALAGTVRFGAGIEESEDEAINSSVIG